VTVRARDLLSVYKKGEREGGGSGRTGRGGGGGRRRSIEGESRGGYTVLDRGRKGGEGREGKHTVLAFRNKRKKVTIRMDEMS